jgi:predicted SPOUT superfamily RNA methylase MTH1
MPRITKKMKLENIIDNYDESSGEDEALIQKKHQKLMKEIKKQHELDPEEKERLEKEKRKEQEKKKRQKKIEKIKRRREQQINKGKPSLANEKTNEEKNIISEVYKRQNYTVSIAIPGSLLKSNMSEQLQVHLAQQIARAATMFRVDEIVVYNEEAKPLDMNKFIPNITMVSEKKVPAHKKGNDSYYHAEEEEEEEEEDESYNNNHAKEEQQSKKRIISDKNILLANILYYLETPPYLRSKLFSHVQLFSSEDLQNELLESKYYLESIHHLLPLEFPHPYREGITVENGSFAYIGCKKLVKLDEKVQPDMRVTVEIYSEDRQFYKGKIVKPSEPRVNKGIFWGYNVRLASSLSEVFTGCTYPTGYDLTVTAITQSTPDTKQNNIGKSTDDANFSFSSFRHLLVVLGSGIDSAGEQDGLEKSISNDKKIAFGTDIHTLCDVVINPLPHCGIRSLQPLETLILTMSTLRPYIDFNVAPLSNDEDNIARQFSFIKQ